MNFIIFYLLLFIVIKILIKISIFLYYLKLKNKNSNTLKSISINKKKLIQLFFSKNNILNIKIKENNNKKFLIFKNYKKNTVFFSNLEDNIINPYDIDQILGRLWLVYFKKIDTKQYNFYKFFSLYFFLIFSYLFNIIYLLLFILIFLNHQYQNNDFFIFMNKYNLYFILSSIMFLLYLSSLCFSYLSKKKLDILYEKNIDNFILDIFPNNLYFFIIIRKYHRKIPLTILPIWFFNKINNSINVGPFSCIF